MAGGGKIVAAVTMALAATGCSSLRETMTPCRVTAIAVGAAVGGLGGGLALASADLPSHDRAGAVTAGTVGFTVVGGLIGAGAAAMICPPAGAPPPAAPAAPAAPGS